VWGNSAGTFFAESTHQGPATPRAQLRNKSPAVWDVEKNHVNGRLLYYEHGPT